MMVERIARKNNRRLSPPTLPPRWGEGVAPPPSPYVSQDATPVTSPGFHDRHASARGSQRGRKKREHRTERHSTRVTSKKPEQTSKPCIQSLTLSHPSPPLISRHRSAPLTSTLLLPDTLQTLHQTSPNTPEMSRIAVKSAEVTLYQNYEAGIAYVPSNPPNWLPTQPQVGTNLSRFQVSPPQSGTTHTEDYQQIGLKQRNRAGIEPKKVYCTISLKIICTKMKVVYGYSIINKDKLC